MAEELHELMKQTVIDGEAEEAAALAQKGLDAGLSPGDILDNGKVFLLELVQSAAATAKTTVGMW